MLGMLCTFVYNPMHGKLQGSTRVRARQSAAESLILQQAVLVSASCSKGGCVTAGQLADVGIGFLQAPIDGCID